MPLHLIGYGRVRPDDLDLKAQIAALRAPKLQIDPGILGLLAAGSLAHLDTSGISRRKIFTGAAVVGALSLVPKIAKAGYGLSAQSSTRFEVLPRQTATGIVNTSCTASSTAGNYGTAVQIGINSFDYDGLYFVQQQNTGAGRNRWTVTYSLNGGADEPLITDLLVDSEVSGGVCATVYCPVSVPRGATLKAKVANSVASRISAMLLTGFQGDAQQIRGFRQMMAAVDYSGFDPANTITLNGTTPTAYQTAMAATPVRFAALMVSPDTLTVTPTIALLRLDIAVGPSGSENYLFSTFYAYPGSVNSPANIQGPFPCDIPAGSRIAYRGVAGAANTTTISAALNGFPA